MVKKLTPWILLGAALALIAWDIYAYLYGDYATISEWVWSSSHTCPIFTLAVGILIGHLFWPQKPGND